MGQELERNAMRKNRPVNDYAFPGAEPTRFGMTLRDYFAGRVLPEVYATVTTPPMTRKQIAEESYKMADEMLKERGNA
jgi:hypothetical protein